jgi:uncharacterized protein YlzI (FlbEa/FlbD family)
MAIIRFDKEHTIRVEESIQEVHDKIVGAGAAYTPLIQVRLEGEDTFSTVNAHAIRTVTDY